MKLFSLIIGIVFLFETNLNAQTTVDFVVTNPCTGRITSLINTSISTDVISELNWDLDNDGAFDDASGLRKDSIFDTSDTFTIGLQIITDVNDTSFAYKDIAIGPIPNTIYTIDNNCVNESTRFINSSTIESGTITNVFWIFGDDITSLLGGVNYHTYADTGSYDVSLISMSDLGCKDTSSKTIQVYSGPTFEIGMDGDSILINDEELTLTVSGIFDSIYWNTGSSGSTITVNSGGKYTATAIDSTNCTGSDYVLITSFAKEIEIYNAITPNGDNKNETWDLSSLTQVFDVCEVIIYNKWGTEVYKSTKYDNSWKGDINGTVLPDGNYYYTINCDNGDYTKTGSLTILK